MVWFLAEDLLYDTYIFMLLGKHRFISWYISEFWLLFQTSTLAKQMKHISLQEHEMMILQVIICKMIITKEREERLQVQVFICIDLLL